MLKNPTNISREEAKELYCKGDNVYICNDTRKYWKLPSSYEYGSNESAEELFNRSIPTNEGETKFYK